MVVLVEETWTGEGVAKAAFVGAGESVDCEGELPPDIVGAAELPAAVGVSVPNIVEPEHCRPDTEGQHSRSYHDHLSCLQSHITMTNIHPLVG